MNQALNLADQTILIVDDNPTNLGVIVDYLEDYGFEIMTALTGEDALEKATREQPHIILLDVMMPGIDGFDTCRQLKQNELTQDIPVIFMTALASEDDKVRGFEAGAVDYVTKPIQQREMLARVTTHLQLRELTNTLRAELAHRQQVEESLRESQQRLAVSYQREQARRRLSDTLRQVATIVSSTLDPQEVLNRMLTQLEKVIIYHRASVSLLVDDQLKLIGGRNTLDVPVPETVMPVVHYPLNEMTLQAKKPILVADVTQDDRWLVRQMPDPTRSFINAPLLVDGRPIGLLGVGRKDAQPYTEDDAQTVFAFATQVAIALENARLVERTQKALDELAKTNADKDKFFSIVAHDLKGPFMPLLGNAEFMAMMSDQLSPADVKELSESIYRSGKQLVGLLENLLHWSRLQMGRLEYNPEPIDLRQIIDRNVALLEPTAIDKNITLHSEVVTALLVYADEYMLDTVIRNLTNNALKFTPPGGQVMISAQPSDQFVEVVVADTGVGIKAADIDKLFKIEVHHSTSGTAKETGTGLGLIICKEMVELNEGQIWVTSVEQQGTKFFFTVPQSSDG